MASNDREATKRLAQQGQWKTPPLPIFASGSHHPQPLPPESSSSDPVIPLPTTLPATPDEYARMLQEAYKRGAEAARAQKTEEDYTDTSAAAVAPSAAYAAAPQYNNPQQQQYPQKSVSTMQANAAANYNFPLLQQSTSNTLPSTSNTLSSTSDALGTTTATAAHQPTFKSVSMPDISSYHQEAATEEEEKRKKRLARNRASARLRRLKKKNLVDSYEGEVGILEASLAKLRSHTWSTTNTTDNHEALIEALSMERGQQPLTPQNRRELIQAIVTQQKEQVENLMDCQLENWMLSCVSTTSENTEDELMKELTDELSNLLQLTPSQLHQISQSSTGCIREIQDLNTISSCLNSILSNEWLLDEGVDEIASQFTGILNPNQLSKFLLWTDHNAEAIEKLDYVNVGGVESGPVFEFGVDEGMEGGD
ncbi:hypothetical protein ACHAWO_002245 [Cyclotella atomus]|uniref:BZIP domain-containing protein n=1 Tax=Cyclotella atomus TaxID=382360 RepID=A0ABD3N5B7_9STRA